MSNLEENLNKVLDSIKQCCDKCSRDETSVNLLCVSKTKPLDMIKEVYSLGQRHFGENYAQEGFDKINALKDLGYKDIVWHFIGPLQANKTKLIVNSFDLVESVDRERIARRLHEQRDMSLGPLDILVQVNISSEPQKSGVAYEELEGLVNYIMTLDHLRLRGFMGIAEDTSDKDIISLQFMRLKQIFELYQHRYEHIDILSMGMTHDMAEAIACGSTSLRIGTAIFGARNYANS